MSNFRAIVWLLSAILLTAAAHLLLTFNGDVDRALVRRTSLVDVQPAEVTRLAVERRGSPRTVLERSVKWRLVEPCASSVDELAVQRLLDALTVLEIEDAVGDQELLRLDKTRADFGLDEPAVRVSAWAGAVERSVSFGLATPSGDGVYAAVEGEGAVYVVASNVFAAADVPADGFRNRELLPPGTESVLSFDVRRGSGSFMRFVREGEMWKISASETATASSDKVRRLLDGIVGARAVDFVWPVGAAGEQTTATDALLAGYGLDPENSVTVTVKYGDGADRQVSFGKEAKDGLVYASVRNARAVVTVDGALKDAALSELSDFVDDRLFPFDRDLAVRLSVADGGVSYLLAKGEGGAWLLDAPVAAATDPDGVAELLGRVFALRNSDVSAEGVSVSVNSAPAVVVARRAALGDFRLESLRSREILSVEPANVRRIVSAGAAGGRKPVSVVFDRDLRSWKVESSESGGMVVSEAVAGVLAAISPLRAEWIVKLKVTAADLRGYGLETPKWTVAVDQSREGSVRRNILVGDQAQGGWFATIGGADAVFVLSDAVVGALTAPLVGDL